MHSRQNAHGSRSPYRFTNKTLTLPRQSRFITTFDLAHFSQETIQEYGIEVFVIWANVEKCYWVRLESFGSIWA
jgi:hypothetical protein